MEISKEELMGLYQEFQKFQEDEREQIFDMIFNIYSCLDRLEEYIKGKTKDEEDLPF